MNGDLSTSCNLSNCDCDKPKPMTDQRARELAEDCKAQDPRAAQFIEKALADERRRVWEEAAKLICPYCNDPEWVTSDPEGDHLSPHTGTVFVCKSRKIRAKAHAGQEG